MRHFLKITLSAVVLAASLPSLPAGADALDAVIPAASSDLPRTGTTQTAVLAGGCFWGMQGMFEHVVGVSKVVAGYAGGEKSTASYEMVTTETTGHAEAVEITFDPTKVSYGDLLRLFFSVAHDPTQLNRQGWDIGDQYRSAIFFHDEGQQETATSSKEQQQGRCKRPVVTQIEPAQTFFEAEDYHQQYLEKRGRSTCTPALRAAVG